jgi:hypothetical protein
MCISYISGISCVSCHIPSPTVCVSHFARFQGFSSYFISYHVTFSFSSLSGSRHIPGSTVCVSHFTRFFSFITIIQALWCTFLIFTFFSVSRNIPGHTVIVSHFTRFSLFLAQPRSYSISYISRFSLFLAIFHVLQCVFFNLHDFQLFSPYFMYYHVSFSFSSFVSFL